MGCANRVVRFEGIPLSEVELDAVLDDRSTLSQRDCNRPFALDSSTGDEEREGSDDEGGGERHGDEESRYQALQRRRERVLRSSALGVVPFMRDAIRYEGYFGHVDRAAANHLAL